MQLLLLAIGVTLCALLVESTTRIVELETSPIVEERLYLNHQLVSLHSRNAAIRRLQILPFDTTTTGGGSSLAGVFTLNQTSLSLHMNGRVDRERLLANGECQTSSSSQQPSECTIRVRIACYDALGSLGQLAIANVRVLDVNDSPPRFASASYSLNVSENGPSGSLHPLEAPSDADSPSNGLLNCSLRSAPELTRRLFSLRFVGDQQQLFLSVNEPLDREAQPVHEFLMACSDGVHAEATALLQVNVLDVNDNAPSFLQPPHNVSVEENSSEQTVVARVRAHDADEGANAALVYSLPVELNSPATLASFDIDAHTGAISLRHALDFDTLRQARTHSLRVSVRDSSANDAHHVQAEVHVHTSDTNDNAPVGRLTHNERALSNATVGEEEPYTLWMDEEMSVTDGMGWLDVAYLSVSDVDMRETNGGALTASLLVNDESDACSTSTKTAFRLDEIIGDYDNVYYALRVTRPLDRELCGQHELTLLLADHGTRPHAMRSTLRVRIVVRDINDHSPQMCDGTTHINVTVDENHEPEPEKEIARVCARDLDAGDNARLSFALLSANSSSSSDDIKQLFSVDAQTGAIRLLRPLDRELRHSYSFDVEVSDAGLPSPRSVRVPCTVHVRDLNDHPATYDAALTSPRFFQLDENMPAGTRVGSVRAHDPDEHARTEYAVEPAAMADWFEVDATSGDLITRRSLDADSAAVQAQLPLRVRIVARDPHFNYSSSSMGENSFNAAVLNVTVHLNDVNDNAPVIHFDGEMYYSSVTLSNASNRTKQLASWRTSDADRGGQAIGEHTARLVSVRRISWPFVRALLAHRQRHTNTSSSSSNNETSEQQQMLASAVDAIVAEQKRLAASYRSGVDVRSLFELTSLPRLAHFALQFNNTTTTTLSEQLNWGVYMVRVRVADDSLHADRTVYVFVHDSSDDTNQTLSLQEVSNALSAFLDAEQHKTQPSEREQNTDDNGDQLELLAAQRRFFFGNGAGGMSLPLLYQQQQQQREGELNLSWNETAANAIDMIVQTAGELMVGEHAYATLVVALIGAFVCASLLLTGLIVYKHHRDHAALVAARAATAAAAATESGGGEKRRRGDSTATHSSHSSHSSSTNTSASDGFFTKSSFAASASSLSSGSGSGKHHDERQLITAHHIHHQKLQHIEQHIDPAQLMSTTAAAAATASVLQLQLNASSHSTTSNHFGKTRPSLIVSSLLL